MCNRWRWGHAMVSLQNLLSLVTCFRQMITSRRTLRPDVEGPTTAHVSFSRISQFKSVKYGDWVSPRGYTVAPFMVMSGSERSDLAVELNWRRNFIPTLFVRHRPSSKICRRSQKWESGSAGDLTHNNFTVDLFHIFVNLLNWGM